MTIQEMLDKLNRIRATKSPLLVEKYAHIYKRLDIDWYFELDWSGSGILIARNFHCGEYVTLYYLDWNSADELESKLLSNQI
jgi:hypothetical protein